MKLLKRVTLGFLLILCLGCMTACTNGTADDIGNTVESDISEMTDDITDKTNNNNTTDDDNTTNNNNTTRHTTNDEMD